MARIIIYDFMYFVWFLECNFSSIINYLNVDVQSVKICDFYIFINFKKCISMFFLFKSYIYTQLKKNMSFYQ